MAEGTTNTDQRNRNGLATQASAYLQLLGYLEPGHESKPGESKITEALKAYRQQNKIPEATRTVDVLRQMKQEIAADPEATRRMESLAAGKNGQPPSVHDVSVVQFGLQARNSPVEITGTMNEPTRNSLASASAQADSAAKIAAATTARAAFSSAAKYNPQVAEAQAYMRILGFNGKEGKPDTGPIDGIKGPLTTAALEQFSKENKFPKDAPMSEIIAALKSKALAGPGLARMEDIMGKPVVGVSQDVKAVQAALRANGMNVGVTGRHDSNTVAAINVQKSRMPTNAPAATPAEDSPERQAELRRIQAQARMEHARQTEQAPSAQGNAPRQLPDIELQAAREDGPKIHVAPGGETAGVTPKEGVIPTVVVDATPAPPVSASPDPSAADVEKANMRAQMEAQQAQIRALRQEQAAMKATGVHPPETNNPIVVGRGPHLSRADGAYAANASQRWSTPPGGAYAQAASVAREIERGNPEAAGIRVDSFRMGNREVVYAQTPDGMAYKFNSTRDGTLMTAGAYNMNNPRESQMFNREMQMADRQQAGSDRQMQAMEQRERMMRERELRTGSMEIERGMGQMGDRNRSNDISGAINVGLGALKIFRPGGGLGF